MSTFDLSGQVALITGSSRGIGRSVAEAMGKHGAKVVVSSRKPEACAAVAEVIRRRGAEVLVQPCNIEKKDELEKLASATLATWGRIDILVCNAAINPSYGPSLTLSDETFERVMNANVRSTFWLCNMVLPQMAANGGGSIIVISSIAAFQGNDKIGAYAISKAAEVQLVRNIAVEWGGRNVRANAIAPGLIRTDFSKAVWTNPASRSTAERITPLGRLGEPEDIAGAAVLLASPAGRFITGQCLVIDGGRLVSGRVAD